MKYSLNGTLFIVVFELISTETSMIQIGLIGNLKTTSTPMHRLYLTMKEHSPDQITMEEILVASGQKVIDPEAISQFIGQVESANQDIQRMFEKQVQVKAVCKHL